jgi:hypothetical protein
MSNATIISATTIAAAKINGDEIVALMNAKVQGR